MAVSGPEGLRCLSADPCSDPPGRRPGDVAQHGRECALSLRVGLQATWPLPNASEACSPGIEVEDARDDLERAMLHLPLGAKRDLGRLITRIDEEFERRTLPEPNYIESAMDGWWWTRMRER